MEWLKKHKKGISIIFIIMIIMLITVTKLKAYSIEEVQFVEPYLEYDGLVTIVLRNLGEWIYSVFSMFLNMVEQGFTELMKFDVLQLEQIKDIIDKFDIVVYSLLFIMFIVVVFIRMFQFQNNLKTLYNVMMTFLVISIVAVSLSMIGNTKNALVSEVDQIVKGNSQDTIAEKLYKDNTVDIVVSMKKGRVVHLSEMENINLNYVNIDTRIDKKMLNEYYAYDEDGTKQIEKLSSGFFGIGDERYLRYRTDYWAVNLTVFFATIIYGLGIFKLAYLIWNWLQLNIFSKLYLGKGFWEVSNVGRLFKQAIQVIGGMVLLYLSMMLFTVFMSNIITTNLLSNYIVKAIVIFSAGMATVVGSGMVNEFLGIDDGSSFALKSIFVGSKLGRMGRGVFNKGKDLINSSFNMGKKGANMLNKGMEKGIEDTYNKVAQHHAQEFERKEAERMKDEEWQSRTAKAKEMAQNRAMPSAFRGYESDEEKQQRIDNIKADVENRRQQRENKAREMAQNLKTPSAFRSMNESQLKENKEDYERAVRKQKFIEEKQKENSAEWDKYNTGNNRYSMQRPLPKWYDYGDDFDNQEMENERNRQDELERKNFDKDAFLEKMRKLRENDKESEG